MSTGEYETELETQPEIITDQTCKRLLSAMQWGIVITHGDGHRWIYSFVTDENGTSINNALREKKLPPIRGKCYGSVIDALNRVDGALKILGWPSLLQTYEDHASYQAWG